MGAMKGETSVFDPRVVAAVVAAGIVAFVGFMLLFAYADDFRRGRDGRAHPLSVSAVGYAGLVKLIRLEGGTARLIRTEQEAWQTEDLLVVTVDETATPGKVQPILAAREGRTTLIVLPKWMTLPLPSRPGWVQTVGMIPASGVAAPLQSVKKLTISQARIRGNGYATGRGILAGLKIPLPATMQSLSGEKLEPLLVGPAGRVLIASDGPNYYLADPDLLNNKGIKDPTRAKAALALLDALNATGAEGVAFDLTLNGFARKPGALKLAFEPPFLALTVAIFIAAILAGLHGAFRFGPALAQARAVAFGKSALVENSAGLFRLARREAAVGPAYADLIREAAAFGSGASAELQGEALDAYLDRLSPDAPFSSLAERAGAARDRFALLAAARALFSWKKDLIP
jgi:hypothetical protein